MAQRQSTSAEQRSLGADVQAHEAAPDSDDVLVYSARKGIYQATLVQRDDEHSTERQPRLNVTPMVCFPGLTLVSRRLWTALEGKPGTRDRIANGELREIVDWSALSPQTAAQYVRDSAHVLTLRRLLEGERRDQVEAALRRQIGEAEAKAPAGSAAASGNGAVIRG